MSGHGTEYESMVGLESLTNDRPGRVPVCVMDRVASGSREACPLLNLLTLHLADCHLSRAPESMQCSPVDCHLDLS